MVEFRRKNENMSKVNIKINCKLFICSIIFFLYSFIICSEDFYDYPLHYLVDACSITQKRYDPSKVEKDEMIEGRKKYRSCMNFIMSLSTTLNRRCMDTTDIGLKPEEAFTYADLSKVQTTQDLIKEVMRYAKENPHFSNQIAWLHASKAISQKWPCEKLF